MNQQTPSNFIARRDAEFHLHSQTNPTQLEERGPLVVARGEGIRVFDAGGKAYIDAMAGLWPVESAVGVVSAPPRRRWRRAGSVNAP